MRVACVSYLLLLLACRSRMAPACLAAGAEDAKRRQVQVGILCCASLYKCIRIATQKKLLPVAWSLTDAVQTFFLD